MSDCESIPPLFPLRIHTDEDVAVRLFFVKNNKDAQWISVVPMGICFIGTEDGPAEQWHLVVRPVGGEGRSYLPMKDILSWQSP